ncbi:type I-E CRISPR-associated endoribonuclease Cas2e [Streptomyces yaizuensis]|uniref:Type I-E CRISPR-associated endoribonuclease Cas2e n=1 Tax=Streptomyces yaizuensis TaxID=2989713 RepID=A0ABQ5P8F9_9ACTN|nr:type I-E CRISPR-associated endoribonuclease Cas2e [Streptomyces sp. YSPA8]GLF98750.1 type I-E CRISPR-associated endoribonuclease Cas2e [Streptomyces sp. YSPA8]
MTVIVLTNCPVGLRGFLTRWLLEISPGVFLGNPSTRVREALWAEVRQYAGQGRALLAYQTNNEQGYTFETHDHGWHPSDHEGLTLIRRPNPKAQQKGEREQRVPQVARQGWSKASKRRRFGGG